MFEFADRVIYLPTYAFAKTEAIKGEARKKGLDLIDLTIGSPDLRPPRVAIDALKEAVDDPKAQLHKYSPFWGIPEFRQAVATWYKQRFDITLDPETEVLPVIGSKEGLERLSMALLNKGDTALIPSPGYPAYLGAVHLCEAIPHEMPLRAENGFIPDLDAIPEDVRQRAKYLLFNYPNNPTGACETDFYEKAVAFCRKYGSVCVSDIPYSELTLDDDASARSIFEIPGSRDVAVEFQSFSKTYSMAGWRIGFAVGQPEVLQAMAKIKANVDFSIFPAMQRAAARVLTAPQEIIEPFRAKYRERRDATMAGLERVGWAGYRPKAAMYVWARVPSGYASSLEFVRDVVMNTGVMVSPGDGFGRHGEGYFRIALVEERARIDEAFARIEKWRSAAGSGAGASSQARGR
jgi:LL-diaminopimelate aminotransferase